MFLRPRQLPLALVSFAVSGVVSHLAARQLPPPSGSGPDAPPGTGVIVGRVIDADRGHGIPGAIVTLSSVVVPAIAPGGSLSPPLQLHVLTTGDGRFLFRDLRKGTYHMSASKSGYLNGSYGARRPGGGSAPIDLEEGQHVTDVSVPVWQWAAITGTIADEAGEPLVGVDVTALRRSTTQGRRQFTTAMTAVTDDRGIYRMSGLTPGDYVVAVVVAQSSMPQAVAEMYRDAMMSNDPARMTLMRSLSEAGLMMLMPGSSQSLQAGSHLQAVRGPTPPPFADETKVLAYPTTFYPAARSAGEATVVTLRSGEERTAVDLDLKPVRTTRITGTVVGPDGPAAHIGLRLEAGADDVVLDPQASTVSDGSGAFTFPAVPAGQYTLRVSQIPRPTTPGSSVTIIQSGNMMISTAGAGPGAAPPPIPSEPTLWAAIPVSAGNAPVTGLTVTLQTGSRVRGRVEFDGTADRPEPAQLQRIQIMVEPVVGRLDFRNAPVTRVEPTGEFATGGVIGGRYFVRVGFAPTGWYFKEARYEGTDLADTPIALEGRDLNGVTIVFTDRPAELSGTVRGGQGPDANATVLIFPAEDEAWTSSGANPRRMRSIRTAKTGGYKAIGLPAGDYYVTALPDELAADWQDPRTLASLARDATRVRVDDGQRKTQDLRTQQKR